jgi:hypothetical protein
MDRTGRAATKPLPTPLCRRTPRTGAKSVLDPAKSVSPARQKALMTSTPPGATRRTAVTLAHEVRWGRIAEKRVEHDDVVSLLAAIEMARVVYHDPHCVASRSKKRAATGRPPDLFPRRPHAPPREIHHTIPTPKPMQSAS